MKAGFSPGISIINKEHCHGGLISVTALSYMIRLYAKRICPMKYTILFATAKAVFLLLYAHIPKMV